MTALAILPAALLLVACAMFVFWPQVKAARQAEHTKLDYLRERQEVIYANLRDLNFEYRAGKYPEQDYNSQRDAMEAEAGKIVNEMRQLEAATHQPAR